MAIVINKLDDRKNSSNGEVELKDLVVEMSNYGMKNKND